MSPPLAYSYVRMSTEAQIRGDSLRRQREASRKYAAENNLTLVPEAELKDIGVSAFHGANVQFGALGRFLAAVEAGEVPVGSYFLVESLDRISRQTVDVSLQLFLRLIGGGVTVVTLSDGQVYKSPLDDPTKLIISIVYLSRANEESETKSKRVGAAWSAKRTRAEKEILTTKCPAWLRPKDDRSGFIPNETRCKVVKQIFELAASGAGTGLITKTLNSMGVPPFGSSNGWIESYITKILKSRAVLGEFQPHVIVSGKRMAVGEPLKNYYPAIIDETLFLRVQAERRSRSVNGGGRRGRAQSNLFTHIAKCGYCSAPMRFVNKGKPPKGGTYLQCSVAGRGMPCSGKSWRYSAFELSVLTFLKEFDLHATINSSQLRKELSLLREERQAKTEKIEIARLERERTLDLLSKITVGVELVAERLQDVVRRMDALEAEVISLNDRIRELTSDRITRPTEEVATQIREFAKNPKPMERIAVNARLKEVADTISVYPDGNSPLLSEKIRLVLSQDISESEKAQIVQAVSLRGRKSDLSFPHFVVHLRDGVHRLVVPEVDDPARLSSSVEVSQGADGSLTVLQLPEMDAKIFF